jgi:hypothetical protein
MQLLKDDPSVPLSANWCPLGAHTGRDVHFADRSADYGRTAIGNEIVDDPTRREIGHDWAGSVGQYNSCRETEGVILSDRAALLRHQR